MQGEWIQQPELDSAIIFVHGILSSAESCWRNENGCFWPQLLANEPALKGVGIYSYTYSTGIFSGNYRLSDVVDDLKERMRLDDIIECKKLLFVCHSMGGIVVRKLLVERAIEFSERKSDIGLFLLASPSLGSTYADMLASLARSVGNAQADALRFVRHNPWLNELDKEFNNLKELKRIQIAGKELIEDKFFVLRKFWRRQIVEPFSGARYFGEPYKVPGSDHFSIAKPPDGRAIQHRLLCRFIREIGIAQINDTSLTEIRNPHSLETLVAEHPILSAAQSEIESSSGMSGALAASLLSSGIPSETLAEFYLIMARRVSGAQLFLVAAYALDLMDKSGVGHSTVEYCLEHLDQDLTELVAQRMRKVVSEAAIIWCHKQLTTKIKDDVQYIFFLWEHVALLAEKEPQAMVAYLLHPDRGPKCNLDAYQAAIAHLNDPTPLVIRCKEWISAGRFDGNRKPGDVDARSLYHLLNRATVDADKHFVEIAASIHKHVADLFKVRKDDEAGLYHLICMVFAEYKHAKYVLENIVRVTFPDTSEAITVFLCVTEAFCSLIEHLRDPTSKAKEVEYQERRHELIRLTRSENGWPGWIRLH